MLPDSDNPDRFSPGSVVYARPERGKAGLRRHDRLQLTVSTVRGDSTFPIVAFEGVDDREGAEALRGLLLEVPADALPALEEGEFYPFELIGLDARDEAGVVRGRVEDVLDNPAHPLLVVAAADASKEIFVPFVADAVPHIAVDEGYLVVTGRFFEQP